MSRIKKPELNEKHLKALGLIEKGQHTLREISKEVGWKEDYLYELYEGDTSKAGSVASVFSAECRKIDKKRSQQLKDLAKTNKSLAHKQILRILTDVEEKRRMSENDRKIVISAMNAISKATPNVEIGNLSYSYTKGYTPEQLIHEFRRLKSLAEGASDRRRVPKAFKRGSGSLPDAPGDGDETQEEL